MLLAEAAKLSRTLRESYIAWRIDPTKKSGAFYDSLSALTTLVKNDDANAGEQLIDILYPKYSRYERQFVSLMWVREDVCKSLGVSPVYWDEVMVGKPIVPMLASESSGVGGEGWTVKQALLAMHRIENEGVLKIAQEMHEEEAVLFWSRAIGEQEPIPIDRFLQMFSYLPNVNKVASLPTIREKLVAMSPFEILNRLCSERVEVEETSSYLQPGQPFRAPLFKVWTSMVAPQGVYADVVKGPRRYLHITEFPPGNFKGILYSRDRQVITKFSSSELPIFNKEVIFEVEMRGVNMEKVTDVFALGDDWKVSKLPYSERMALLDKEEISLPINRAKLLEEGSDIGYLIESLEEQESIRLLKSGPMEIKDDAGWLVLQKAFHIHLILSAICKDDDFNTHLRLSVLDGYETYEVAEVEVDTTVAQHIRTRLGRHGVLVGKTWMPVDEYGIIVISEVTGFDLNKMRVTKMTVKYADDSLGFSDASQLTDLIEIAGD
tara:strand:+ start:838 stop:2313 length:1476 start_codon:yes stop_codon:yes gene_type:complete